MKLLITIMAHAGGQATFDRHMPLWKANADAHGAELMVTCPDDSKIRTPRALFLGKASHHGPTSIMRFRAILKAMHMLKRDWYVLHEYDSVCLSRSLPESIFERPGLWSNLHEDYGQNSMFKGHHFFHPPLMFDYGTLNSIVDAMGPVSNHEEHGFWDRWLGFVQEQNNAFPFHPYGRLGFSQNTIEPAHLGSAIDAIKKGAVMIHGIKDKDCLHALKSAYVS